MDALARVDSEPTVLEGATPAIPQRAVPTTACTESAGVEKVEKTFSLEVARAIASHSEVSELGNCVIFRPAISKRREGIIPPWESRITPGVHETEYMSIFKQVGDEVGCNFAGYPIVLGDGKLQLPKEALELAHQTLIKARASLVKR